MERMAMKIEVKQDGRTTRFILATNGKEVGHISPDYHNEGRWRGGYEGHGACNNSRYPDAVEFITNGIERLFDRYGIDIIFA